MTGPDSAATRDFLEQRFARTSTAGYQPHQPVFGIESGESGQFLRLARTLRLLTWIEALQPESVLDLGSAEGYIANLIRLRVGCPVLCSDLSQEACERAAELYGLCGIAGDLTCLPLKPKCADVVVLSEVFEHLPDPQAGLSAALTYARRFVVFSTQELCASAFEQRLRLALADVDSPHAELNFVTRVDFAQLFGSAVAMAPEFRRTRRRMLENVPRALWRAHVKWLAQPRGWRSSEGLIAVISVDGSQPPTMPQRFDPALLDMLLSGPLHAKTAAAPRDWFDGAEPPRGLVLVAPFHAAPPLHRLLLGSAAIFQRLHVRTVPETTAVLRTATQLLHWLDRIGFLTDSDPLAVKLRWLRGAAVGRISKLMRPRPLDIGAPL